VPDQKQANGRQAGSRGTQVPLQKVYINKIRGGGVDTGDLVCLDAQRTIPSQKQSCCVRRIAEVFGVFAEVFAV